MFKLMLDVEQPDADRGREQHDRQMHQQERPTPISQIIVATIADRGIGRHRAEPRLPSATHQADRQPVLHDEQIGRTYAEHDEGVPVESVAQPA